MPNPVYNNIHRLMSVLGHYQTLTRLFNPSINKLTMQKEIRDSGVALAQQVDSGALKKFLDKGEIISGQTKQSCMVEFLRKANLTLADVKSSFRTVADMLEEITPSIDKISRFAHTIKIRE